MASSHLEALVGPKQDTLNQAWKEGGLPDAAFVSPPCPAAAGCVLTTSCTRHTDKSGFGFKMLMKMGWSEGKGLGKELQGAATHVTVTKKTDSAGLGSRKDDTGNLGWTEASATFDSVLSRLNARYGNDAASSKKAEKKRRKKEKVRACVHAW